MLPDPQPEIFSAEWVSDSNLSATRSSNPEIPGLNALALRSLVYLFSERENLFCRSVALRGNTLVRGESSPKRTAIALLGLRRLAESGANSSFDVRSMHDAVLGNTSWVKSLGELGLLTWLTAECEPARLRSLFRQFDFDKALVTYLEGREARTSHLAWFLAGVSHARMASLGTVPDLTDVAVDAYHLLLESQSEGGIFGRAAFPGWLRRVYRRFGTFADQIFSIYALSIFGKAFHIEEPLTPALNCANSIRSLQGDQGEWWFLYDKRSCRVVNRYPVFSWHQDGTAPVGLLALGEVTGQNFNEPIYKGLSRGKASIGTGPAFQGHQQYLTWDFIQPARKSAKYWEAAFSLANISRGMQKEQFFIRYEARPDHFGWILYAFGRAGLPKSETLARAMTSGSE